MSNHNELEADAVTSTQRSGKLAFSRYYRRVIVNVMPEHHLVKYVSGARWR
jgi:hypothetical protein